MSQENETIEQAATETETVTESENEQATISAEQTIAEAVKQATEEANQRLIRLQADFDNFRRRTQLEKESSAKYAAMPVLLNLLPALDNFERAIAASSQSQDFAVLAKGVEMTAKLLFEGLEKEGLQVMQTIGEPFNPEFHQAVMQVQSDEYEDGIIVEELQKGYLLKDKVIRPAMVKVNSK
jgi:molecular chaperone GrpE